MQTLHDFEVFQLMSDERLVAKRERFTLRPRDHQLARWQRRVLQARQQPRIQRPLLRRFACTFNARAC